MGSFSSSSAEYEEATGKLSKEQHLHHHQQHRRCRQEEAIISSADFKQLLSGPTTDRDGFGYKQSTVSTASTLQMSDTMRSRRQTFSKNATETALGRNEENEDDDRKDSTSDDVGFSRQVRKLSSRWLNELFGDGGGRDRVTNAAPLDCDNSNSNVVAIPSTGSDDEQDVRDSPEDVTGNGLMTTMDSVHREANYLKRGSGSKRKKKNVLPRNYSSSVNLEGDADNNNGPAISTTIGSWIEQEQGRGKENNGVVGAKGTFSSNTSYSDGRKYEALSLHPLHYQTHCYPERQPDLHQHQQQGRQRPSCPAQLLLLVDDGLGTSAGRKYEQRRRGRRRRQKEQRQGKSRAPEWQENSNSRTANSSGNTPCNANNMSVDCDWCDNSSTDNEEWPGQVACKWRSGKEVDAGQSRKRAKKNNANAEALVDHDVGNDNDDDDEAGDNNVAAGVSKRLDTGTGEELQYFITRNNQRDQQEKGDEVAEVTVAPGKGGGGWWWKGRSSGGDNKKFYYSKVAVRE